MNFSIKNSYKNSEKLELIKVTSFLPDGSPLGLRVRYAINGYTEIQTCESGNPLLKYNKAETDIWKYCSDKSCESCKRLKSAAYSESAKKLWSGPSGKRRATHEKVVDKMKAIGHYSRAGKNSWSSDKPKAELEKMTAYAKTDAGRERRRMTAKQLWQSDEYKAKTETSRNRFLDCQNTLLLREGKLEITSEMTLVDLFNKYTFNRSDSYIRELIYKVYGFYLDYGVTKPESVVRQFMLDIDPDCKKMRSDAIDEMRYVELDIYSEKYRLAVEVNGIYWHSSESKEDPRHVKNKHKIKHDWCEKLGIRLLQFTDYEINEKPNIVESIINTTAGLVSTKLMARKLRLSYISKELAYPFFEQNHIKGASYKIGKNVFVAMMNGTEIVSCMHFNIHQNKAEIERFANKTNTIVSGASSRLLHKFVKDNSYIETIISFSYDDYFTGDVYKSLGFKYESWSEGYHWTEDAYLLEHRSKFMKHKLLDRFDWATADMTEDDICYSAGFRKYRNAGYKKWVKHIKKACTSQAKNRK